MTFSRVKPGNWATGERLTSTQMNTLDAKFPDAVDGGAGGTYTPSAALSIRELECPTTPTGGDSVANKTYVDLFSKAQSAKYSIPSLDNLLADLTEVFATSGYTLSAAAFGDQIEVPEVGRYALMATARAENSSATNPSTVDISLRVGGSTISVGGGVRYSTSSSDRLTIAAFTVVNITDTPNEKIQVGFSGSSGTISLPGSVTGTDQLLIFRI